MTTVLDISVVTADGRHTTLAEFRGRVMLVVNVASKCGLTVQYAALEKLYEARRDEGLVVLAFPANDFMGQEPGTEAEIVEFCTTTYDVQFPIFAKLSVKGETIHPLYRSLTAAMPQAIGDGPMRERLRSHGLAADDTTAILWNFEKFLISRDGRVIARFAPDVTADDRRLLSAIEQELAKPN